MFLKKSRPIANTLTGIFLGVFLETLIQKKVYEEGDMNL